MAATHILGAELFEDDSQAVAPAARPAPLTDWRRRRILIAAAAAAAVGAPVRILDIRPEGEEPNGWVRRSRVRTRAARQTRAATPRRPGATVATPDEEPAGNEEAL